MNGAKLNRVVHYITKSTGGSESFYIGLNALEDDILSDGNGAGYGVEFYLGKGLLYIIDETVEVRLDGLDPIINPLDVVSLSLPSSTDLNFEFICGLDNSLAISFLSVDDTKPIEPTYAYTPGVSGPEPTCSGTNLTFGITDEGELQVDHVRVTSIDMMGEVLQVAPAYALTIQQKLLGFALEGGTKMYLQRSAPRWKTVEEQQRVMSWRRCMNMT
jgi:hypothetical protein